jgi:hypothetical protein
MLRSGKVWQIWRFAMFLSILLPLSRNLTPSFCTTSYVHESRRWHTFSLFALSELVCTKKVPYPIHYSLLIYPKLILLWSLPDRQTEKFVHPLFPNSFFHWARGALYSQAQPYWAGRTEGWMANWTRGEEPCPSVSLSGTLQRRIRLG